MADLTGNTAIVTGASSGIGAQTIRALAAAGANVVPAARRLERLKALAEEMTIEYGVEATPVQTDVTDETDVQALIEETIATHGSIDVLVNNAGINTGSDVAELGTEAYRDMMDVNVDGCFFTTREALPHLVASNGNLIFTGSFAGIYPRSFSPVYAATKWWVRGFAQSVSAQYGDEGVGVTIVNPSEVRTEFVASDGRQFDEVFEPGEVTDPAEIAEAIVYAAGTTGTVPLEIDLYRRDKLADSF